MKILLHIPRPYEADVRPVQKCDIEVTPHFYRKQGPSPMLPITTVDDKGRERRYILNVSATNGRLMLQEMREVVAQVDTSDDVAADDETGDEVQTQGGENA